MQRGQWQAVAMGAAVTAAAAAVATGRLPRCLRVALVFGLALIAGGAGFYAYRYVVRPTDLTVAVGSLDGNAQQLTAAIAAQMASSGAPIRLKVIDKANALEAGRAFAAGEADLAVARPDLGDLSNAETVVVVTHSVVPASPAWTISRARPSAWSAARSIRKSSRR
jgi:hypothetical protein